VSRLNGLGGGTLVEISRLNRAGYLTHGGLEAVFKRMLVEDIDAQLVQEGGQGDVRIVRQPGALRVGPLEAASVTLRGPDR